MRTPHAKAAPAMDAGQTGSVNTAESLGWQLRGALPSMRLHSVSVYDSNADILWLSEGALGPDEHGFVMEAIQVLSQDATRAHWACNLEDGRGAFFLAVRAPQGDLVGLVMLLADAKSLTVGIANRILIAPVRAVLQRMAILLRPAHASGLVASPLAAAPVIPPVASIPVVPAAAAQGRDTGPRAFVPDVRDRLDFVPVARADTPKARDTDMTGTAETIPPDMVDEILSFELVDEPLEALSKSPPHVSADPWRPAPRVGGNEIPVPAQLIPELKPEGAVPFGLVGQDLPLAHAVDPLTIPELHALAEDSESEPYDEVTEPADHENLRLTDEAPSASFADEPIHAPRPPVAQPVPHDLSQVLTAPALIPVPEWPKVESIPEVKAATTVEPASTGLQTLRQKAGAAESELIHDDMPADAVPKPDTLPGEFVLYVREITRLRTGGRTRRYEVTLRSAADPNVEMPPDVLSEAAAATENLYPDVLIAAELVGWLADHPPPADGDGDPVSFLIDVTAAALQDPEFPQLIAGQLGHADIATESIGFRIPESTCVQHKPQVARFITACEKLGCFIVLDDFTLHSGAVDFLRSKALRLVMVDSKLTAAATKDKLAQALVVAICQAGKVLGVHCAVKGVDSQARQRWFAAFGFDSAQGPLFPPAQPLEKLTAQKP